VKTLLQNLLVDDEKVALKEENEGLKDWVAFLEKELSVLDSRFKSHLELGKLSPAISAKFRH